MALQQDSIIKILARLESVQKEIQSIRSDLKYIIEKKIIKIVKKGKQKLICFPELFKHRLRNEEPCFCCQLFDHEEKGLSCYLQHYPLSHYY